MKNFLEKVQKERPAGRKRSDRKGNRTRQKNKRGHRNWNQMTALGFQTGGRHQTSPTSLRGERGKTRQTEEEVGRQHQGMDRPGVRQVPEGSEEQGEMEKTGCEVICGAPTTLEIEV